MSTPLVSICLPNLNTRPFLPERFESIFTQTLQDWELVVSDNYSDDGAWDYIQSMGNRDSRLSAVQAPREGMYANWNRCISRARGKYVYIATSDDTMAVDCLEKLAQALETRRECDIAHCILRTIDAAGKCDIEPRWPDCTVFASDDAAIVQRRHVRYAPYDGLLHLTGRITYQSLTQLLIRRSLFARIGTFPTRWGSIGDINWDMKAALVANVVHVPDTWASFRVHEVQATAAVDFLSENYAKKYDEMIDEAFAATRKYLPTSVAVGVEQRWLRSSCALRNYYLALRRERNPMRRRLYQAAAAMRGPASIRSELVGRLMGRPAWPLIAPRLIRDWLESEMGRPMIGEIVE